MQIKCSWLENRISIEPDGYTRPCCGEISESAKISNINDGIVNAFNHTKLLTLRDELSINGYNEKTDFACRRCKEVEYSSQPSLRINSKYLSQNRQLKGIQFKLSNKCQLACAHCGPMLSTQWAKLLNIKPHIIEVDISDNFINELIELLPNITELKFTGGEPFLDPSHWKILEALSKYDRSHCNLIYITNGLISPKIELWQGWNKVICNVSVDGYKDTYEWFRRGASWDSLLSNINILRKVSDLKICYSITPWTVDDFEKTVEFFNWTTVMPTNIVIPTHQNLFKFPKDIATKFWKNKKYIELTDINGDIEVYKTFANYWDKVWDTSELSKKIYQWL